MYNNTNTGYQMNNPLTQLISVRIDGDKIIQIGMQEQVLGYTKQAYDELMSISEEQEKLLIEHGIIKKEKTQEEIMADLSSKMDRILTSIDGIDRRVSDLENSMTETVAKEE